MHTHTLLLLLLLLLLLFPVNVLSQNHPKTLYCWKKRCFFTIFLQHQGQNSSKHTAICSVFFVNAEKTVYFAWFFWPRSLKCIVNTGVGFTCQTSSSQSKPAKTTGIYNVLTRQYAKNIDVLKQISAGAPQFKNQSCALLLPLPIQSRPKKVLNHKKCQTEPTTDILFVAIFATKF